MKRLLIIVAIVAATIVATTALAAPPAQPANTPPPTSTIDAINGPADVCDSAAYRHLESPCTTWPPQPCPGAPDYNLPRCPHPTIPVGSDDQADDPIVDAGTPPTLPPTGTLPSTL